jgi:hypothetical protein
MTVWYPDFRLTLTLPLAGSSSARKSQQDDDSVIRFDMPVKRFRLERNDYSMADVLEVEADWGVAGLDPRLVTDGTCEFSINSGGDDPALQTWGYATPKPSSLRFAGIVQKPSRHWSESKKAASLLFHDYTTIYIAEKPFVTAGMPDYSQTLSQAWARICDHVGPTDPDTGKIVSVIGANLRNNILFLGDAKDVVLGGGVGARFRKDKLGAAGPVDAWAMWQQAVQQCGLISYIEADHLVITTATDYYTAKNPPRLIMGRNLIDLEEERDLRRGLGGIVLQSFDPMTGTTLEVFSPRMGDSSVRKKVLKTSKKKAPTEDQVLHAENREVFFWPGITDVGRLQVIADTVQEVRSRQELAGHISTGAMLVPSAQDVGSIAATADFDLLTLSAGDVVSVEVEPDLMTELLGAPKTWGSGEDARIQIAMDHGYAEAAATVLVANLASFAALGCKFFVRNVITDCDVDAMTYKTEIHYVNRIDVSGNAKA